MNAERFTLDSNILVYAVDSKSAARHRLATALVDAAGDADCVLTRQALGEFFHAVTRKGIASRAAAASQVHDWMTIFATVGVEDAALRDALKLAVTGRLSYWDALLVATAQQAECSFVLSEDMHDRHQFGSVTIRHPFAGADLAPDLRSLIGLDR